MSALCAIFTVANAKLVSIKIFFMTLSQSVCEFVHWITIETVLDMKREVGKFMSCASEGQEFWLRFLLWSLNIWVYCAANIRMRAMFWILNLRWKDEKTWHDRRDKKRFVDFFCKQFKHCHLMFDVFKLLNYCFVLVAVFVIYSFLCVRWSRATVIVIVKLPHTH